MKSVGETKHTVVLHSLPRSAVGLHCKQQKCNLVSKSEGVGQSRPWVLGTLIYEGVTLESWGRFV